ncbi:MAG: CbiX/SirB N-terminal domain-containing protein [Deltaproteobacteria bacterium]|nr:CbiX/SirB N-terminal domain-containing protein [Deltaproteobacteria bacterium]
MTDTRSGARTKSVGIVLLYHGSSSPGAVVAERALAERVAERGRDVVGAVLSHLSGGDEELSLAIQVLVAKGAGRIVVVPMFLAPGGHVQRDVPALVDRARGRFSGVAIGVSEIIGASQSLPDAVLDLISQAE